MEERIHTKMLQVLKSHHYYFKEILAVFFLLMAVYFFKQQHQEIVQSADVLQKAKPEYLLIGLFVTLLYVLFQGLMYVFSFRAVHERISLADSIRLFLKRNFISVFLPGGGVTSLAFFSDQAAKNGISKTKIAFASYIFGVVGFASLALVGIPVIAYLAVTNGNSTSNWLALTAVIIIIGVLYWVTVSFLKKGWIYKKLYSISPQFEAILAEINEKAISKKQVYLTLLCSIVIEFLGIAHIGIAMLAIGLPVNIEACIAGYVIATIFYAISPFLRGLGAVEVSLVLILQSYQISNVIAFSVTLLYRFFEFWVPLALGIAAFFSGRKNLVLRIFPAAILAALGVVNIISVLTPPFTERLQLLENFLSTGFIHFSNLTILGIGLTLLVCAAFLLKGFKNAWRIAMLLSLFSFIGHITKGVDYEEAALALFCILTLWLTRKSYQFRNDPKIQTIGLYTTALTFSVALFYGVVGFILLDTIHFRTEYSFSEALAETIRCFLLMDLTHAPQTGFGKWFIHSINALGVFSLCMLVYTLLKPYISKLKNNEQDREKALKIVSKYGKTADDYFKTYADKLLFFADNSDGFIAYKVSSGFAIALGEPVCEDKIEVERDILLGFEKFCLSNNVKPAYYKVAEDRLDRFIDIGDMYMPIGREAVVDLEKFSLAGKEGKSLRHTLHTLEKKGYFCKIYQPPLKDGLLQKLNFVSDDWLAETNREEILFSSGKFDLQELKNQEIIVVENEDEKVVAFLNVIPDYKADEGTYDLIRKTKDAPSGVIDALIVCLIQHLQSKKIKYLNMGMASMSEVDKPKDLPGKTVKFAYEKLKQFKHYHGLYEFKDKYNPDWEMRYLVYQNHYDLISLPLALSKIMKLHP